MKRQRKDKDYDSLVPSAILFCHFGIIASKMSAKIKDIRLEAKLTQAQAASYVGVPLRTYIRYEHDNPGVSEIKRDYIIKRLQNLTEISEEKGILSLDTIQRIISEIFTKHSIQLCYLFGSYAKGYASDKSDVDLLIDTDIKVWISLVSSRNSGTLFIKK